MKLSKEIYELNHNKIINDYRLKNDKINILINNKIEKLDEKYIQIINKYGYNDKIEKMKEINRLNEIIYNTYNIYSNNYYNSININNIIINHCNSKIYSKNDLIIENANNILIAKNENGTKKDLINKYENVIKQIKLDYENKLNEIKKEFSILKDKYEIEVIKIKFKKIKSDFENKKDYNINRQEEAQENNEKIMKEEKMTTKKTYSKLYFNFLPKEEVSNFITNFIKILKETQRRDEKKEFEFNIKGTKENLKGISYKLSNLEKGKDYEIIDKTKEHIQKALYIISISFNAIDEKSVKDIEDCFKQLEPWLVAIPIVKKNPDNYNVHFRKYGKKIYIDFSCCKEEFLESFLNIGLNKTEFFKICCCLQSAFWPKDFFELPIKESFLKLMEFSFELRAKSFGINNIIDACIQALKDIHLKNDKFQKRLDENIVKLKMLNAYISFLFNFEFNVKKLPEIVIFEKGNINKDKIIEFAHSLKPLFEKFQLVDVVKGIDFDEIIISIGFPKYENGYINRIYLPGLSQQFKKIVFGN